ncbi:hypothetical protein CW304_19095 [Bacillus sp. UFRGS-B20]|nr:hypothetical protein CW304_19095 [Bacillus sp. UFRGS-B20]
MASTIIFPLLVTCTMFLFILYTTVVLFLSIMPDLVCPSPCQYHVLPLRNRCPSVYSWKIVFPFMYLISVVSFFLFYQIDLVLQVEESVLFDLSSSFPYRTSIQMGDLASLSI